MSARKHAGVFWLSIALNVALLGAGALELNRRGGLQYIAALSDRSPTVSLSDLKRDIHAAHTGDIVLLGDSILDLAEPEFFDFPVLNRGISGDTTSGVLARLPDILAGEPKTVVLMVGINDLQRGSSANEVIGRLRQIIEAIPSRLVLLPLLPVNEAKYRQHILQRAPTATMPRRSDVEAINAFLSSYPGFSPLDVLKDGQLADEYTLDGLHLNAAGLAVLARTVQTR